MSKSDSVSNLLHYVKVKPNIVVGRQDRRSDLTGGEEMPKIRAGVAFTNAAGAVRIDGPLIFRIARVLDEHAAFTGIETGVTSGAGWQDAIHHVDAASHIIG